MNRMMSLAAALLLAACADQPTAVETASLTAQTAAPALKASASENQGLAMARAATARFHRFDVAYNDAGYNYLFMNMCMVDGSPAAAGGMGYHYVNLDLLDDQLDPAHPEAVLYEPGPDGQLRLVGLEYVIPADAWHSTSKPRLFGQDLELNAFGLWALHTWIWKSNPAGIYKPWNPTVNCDNDALTNAPRNP